MMLKGAAQNLIKAHSVSELVRELPGNTAVFPGVVYGIFSSAIYIKIKDKLITVTTREQGNFPYGILLQENIPVELTGLAAKEKVLLHNDFMSFLGKLFFIDFSEALTWNPGAGQKKDTSINRVKKNLVVFSTCLTSDLACNHGLAGLARYFGVSGEGFDCLTDLTDRDLNIYCQAAIPILSTAFKNLEKVNYRKAMTILADLIGLGQGLTPSGDDLLLGMMAVFYLGSNLCPSLDLLMRDTINNICSTKNNLTTEVSRFFLAEAATGRFAEKILDVTNSLLYKKAGDLIDNIKSLAEIGATSGLDIATGIMIGGIMLLKCHELHC